MPDGSDTPQPKRTDFYVYALIDPRDSQPFYIGKGCGKRYQAHLREWKNAHVLNHKKFGRIGEIYAASQQVEIRILSKDLEEHDAFRIERECIQHIGIENLTNLTNGGNNEKSKVTALAHELLARMLPFSVWIQIAKPRPNLKQIAIYFRVMRAMRRYARGEFGGREPSLQLDTFSGSVGRTLGVEHAS